MTSGANLIVMTLNFGFWVSLAVWGYEKDFVMYYTSFARYDIAYCVAYSVDNACEHWNTTSYVDEFQTMHTSCVW